LSLQRLCDGTQHTAQTARKTIDPAGSGIW